MAFVYYSNITLADPSKITISIWAKVSSAAAQEQANLPSPNYIPLFEFGTVKVTQTQTGLIQHGAMLTVAATGFGQFGNGSCGAGTLGTSNGSTSAGIAANYGGTWFENAGTRIGVWSGLPNATGSDVHPLVVPAPYGLRCDSVGVVIGTYGLIDGTGGFIPGLGPFSGPDFSGATFTDTNGNVASDPFTFLAGPVQSLGGGEERAAARLILPFPPDNDNPTSTSTLGQPSALYVVPSDGTVIFQAVGQNDGVHSPSMNLFSSLTGVFNFDEPNHILFTLDMSTVPATWTMRVNRSDVADHRNDAGTGGFAMALNGLKAGFPIIPEENTAPTVGPVQSVDLQAAQIWIDRALTITVGSLTDDTISKFITPRGALVHPDVAQDFFGPADICLMGGADDFQKNMGSLNGPATGTGTENMSDVDPGPAGVPPPE